MPTATDALGQLLSILRQGLGSVDDLVQLANTGDSDDQQSVAATFEMLALGAGANTELGTLPAFGPLVADLDAAIAPTSKFADRVSALARLPAEFTTVETSLGNPSLQQGTVADFVLHLAEAAVLAGLDASSPWVSSLLRALQLVETKASLRRISTDNLATFLSQPGAYVRTIFGAAALDSLADATSFADRVLRPLADVPIPGAQVFYGIDGGINQPPFLTFLVGNFDPDTTTNPSQQSLAFTIAPNIAGTPGGPGFTLSLGGSWTQTFPLGDNFAAQLTVNAPDALSATLMLDGTAHIDAGVASLAFSVVQQPGASWVFGDPDNARLELSGVALALKVGADDIGFEIALANGLIHIAAPDEFIAQAIPNGVDAPFSATLDWTWKSGLRFRGTAGFELKLPLALTIGPLSIADLDLRVTAGGTSPDIGLQAALTTTVDVELGPVDATIQGLGIAASLGFPGTKPNLGFAQLSATVPFPTGASLKIDAGPVSGGGALFFDPAKFQYAGVGALSIHTGIELALDIVLVITTRPEVSVLVLASVEFSPGIAIFGGFFLTGIGLLVGVNRAIDAEVLRDGVRTGLLESVLFPDDPLANPSALVANVNRVFPPAHGQFVLGVLVEISYGPAGAELFTVKLGLVVQLGGAFVLAVLGELGLSWPKGAGSEILVLNLSCVGIWDSAKKLISIDAALHDSKVLTWPLTGGAAFRAGPGIFLLSVGGYHPHFQPPPGFPQLDRLGISISAGPAKIRFQTYTAITSNTFQIGAAADVLLDLKVCSAEGHLSFDALLQFEPFHFEVDIDASLTIKVAGATLLGIQVDVHVSGPGTWHLAGHVAIEILCFKIKAGFDATFGQAKAAPSLPPVNAASKLAEALALPSSWTDLLPDAVSSLVTVATSPSPTLIRVHPLADLVVRQRVVPLGVEIDKLGVQRIAARTSVSISAVSFSTGGTAIPVATPFPAAQDLFAAAQFIDMSDTDKLARPSFELMSSGVTLANSAVTPSAAQSAAITYTTDLVDDVADPSAATAYSAPAAAVLGLAGNGPVAGRSPAALVRAAPKVSIQERRYVVASRTDRSPHAPAATFTLAQQAARRLASQQPGLAGGLQLLGSEELAA